MKQMVVFVSLVALVFPCALTGCCRALRADLETTRAERDELQAQVIALQKSRNQSAEHSQELTGSLGELQKQVDAFISFREELQKREDELAKLRASALAEAQTAQARMDQLAAELQVETEKVRELQAQLELAQRAVTELQDKLKP